MTKSTKTKTLKNKTTETARAVVIIDFGNGEVKVKAKLAEATKWSDYSFPSFVAESAQPGKHCLTVITDEGLKTFIVGERARDIPCARTGATEGRKAEISNVLFLYALRLVFGVTEGYIHTDVIFTAPSIVQYGAEMITRLQKRHHVQVPKSAYVPGSKEQNYAVDVHRAIPMLEGHLGYTECGSNLKAPIWVFDVGNRTINVTKVDEEGDILARRPFDNCGVYEMADRVVAGELLGEKLKTPSPQKVVEYLFSGGAAAATDIQPALAACLGEALAFVGNDPADKWVIGGGALLPGVATAIGAQVGKAPQWANVNGIAKHAPEILEES